MEQETTNNGIGLGGVLLIVFITLKLCKVITWSWWWVLAPIWMPFALVVTILGIYVLVKVIVK